MAGGALWFDPPRTTSESLFEAHDLFASDYRPTERKEQFKCSLFNVIHEVFYSASVLMESNDVYFTAMD